MTEITTYEKAADIFATARNKDHGKPLANNTRLIRLGLEDEKDILAVRLHDTNVVTYNPSGKIEFTTGGWHTVTTKDRINRFSPINVWQHQRVWYVARSGYGEGDAFQYGFKDGMYLDGKGFLVDADPDPSIQKKYIKLAKDYSKRFVRELSLGNVGVPSAGDCFFCLSKTVETGRTLHEEYVKHNDFGGILSHIEEPYYVPSLLVRAMDRFGVSRAAQSYAWSHMQSAKESYPEADSRMGGICSDQIQKAVYRYTLGLLGVAV